MPITRSTDRRPTATMESSGASSTETTVDTGSSTTRLMLTTRTSTHPAGGALSACLAEGRTVPLDTDGVTRERKNGGAHEYRPYAASPAPNPTGGATSAHLAVGGTVPVVREGEAMKCSSTIVGPKKPGSQAKSSRSSKRKEAEAKMELARRELEVAEARSRVAQAEMELIRMQSESEDEEDFEEDVGQHGIEAWFDKAEHTEVPLPPSPEQLPSSQPMLPQPLPLPPPGRKSKIEELAEAITKISRSTPSEVTTFIELPYFDGAAEEWLAFRRSYEDTALRFSHVQNLARLRRSLQGKAREAVKSLLFTAEHPEEVMKGLQARFGRPGALALAELEKMKNLPRVTENPNDVCTFFSHVRNCVATIKALGKKQYLSSPETMKSLIEKMPPSMKYRWFIFHRSHHDEDIQELELINDFLEIEADMCGDFAPPEVSWEVKKTRQHPDHPPKVWEQRKSPLKRMVHTIKEKEGTYPKPTSKACPVCNEEHWLYECQLYKEADTNAKWEMVKKARLCFKCLRYRHSKSTCKAMSCRKCRRWHHTSLHQQRSPPATIENRVEDDDHKEVVTSIHGSINRQVYLKMIEVDLYGPKGSARILALLDEGSTVTLLDAEVAKQIGAEGKPGAITIETVGGNDIRRCDSQKTSVKIKGAHRKDKRSIEVRTIDGLKLSKQVVEQNVVRRCVHLQKIEKELVYEEQEPRLLIGQDNWGLIVTRKLKKGKTTEPVASLASLGWVLHGYDATGISTVTFVNHSKLIEEDKTEALVRYHFEIDSIGVQPRRPSNDADQRALEVLQAVTRRLPTGKFESGLLWKSEDEELPNNYEQAYRRLINIEKKLDKDEKLKSSYEEQMKNLIENGYAEKAPRTTTAGRTFYLPHFAVVHPVKQKPRIVLDAAAKYNGKSFNDALLPGPDFLQSLFGVLIRFRERPVAVIADIKDMFLRVQMREEDRDSLRFLWRGDRRQGRPEEYRMNSVVFGATSSPSTAIYVMNKNAECFKEEYPAAVEAIEKNHYMDDYLQSFSTEEEACRVAQQVPDIHAKAGFHLRKWGSNRQKVLEGIEEQLKQESTELVSEEKTLGLRWLMAEDMFAFNVKFRTINLDVLDGKRIPTKREVTSAVMSTFDPMGLAAPVLIQGKKLIQDIWRTKIGWDDEIQEDQKAAWDKYVKEVSVLRDLLIPRCISPKREEGELHTFCDASEEAYAAAAYWRTIDPDSRVHITLIAGKARVSPSKPVSIPRLELQAALLGSRLAATIEDEMGLKITRKQYWTDSSTVLQWIKSDPRKFKTFVAHRLAEIEELTKPQDWRWVPTKENPPDDATRGTPQEFDRHARWFNGPAFLRDTYENWPKKRFESNKEVTGEQKNLHVVGATKVIESSVTPDPDRFSSWVRLLRTSARVFQFIDVVKKRAKNKEVANLNVAKKKDEPWKLQKRGLKKKTCISAPVAKKAAQLFLPLEEDHIKRAENELIKRSQQESFPNEIAHLKDGRPIEKSSPLKRFEVYLDDEGTIKLRSRARKICIEERSINPIALHGKQRITRLIIEHYHRKFFHGNTMTVINEIRQKYWILSLRTTTKAIVHRCQWCKVHKSSPRIPPVGDLPVERLRHHQPPFSCAAVDYFGPLTVTVGRRTEKRWGALFTCLTTRAVHLELANSLNTDSMIMALRRMAARRGTPKVIFSDNGTNFISAHRELEDAASHEGIKWKFIPPGCPNMGGAWERLVRSVKTALMAILQSRSPPEEVLHTLLTEVEHVVNSRLLTHISLDPDDEEGLTPNHFLIGRSCGAPAPGVFEDVELIKRANWKTAQRLTDHFWSRWVKEYLPTLLPKKVNGTATEDPRIGDIVLVVDATLPRNTWPRGKVHQVYPGPDGRVRVLDVQTPWGILRRPTRRVIILVPATASLPQEGVLRTAGETVSDAS